MVDPVDERGEIDLGLEEVLEKLVQSHEQVIVMLDEEVVMELLGVLLVEDEPKTLQPLITVVVVVVVIVDTNELLLFVTEFNRKYLKLEKN